MRFRLALPALLAAALALAACGPRRIPGTDITDTPDTRAIVATIEAYRQAAEQRDAAKVMELVSRRYYDDAGTPDPGDDIDYAQLEKRLAEDYRKITVLRLDIGVKKIDVEGDRASAYVYYDERYRIATKSGEVAKQASDQHRMVLVAEGRSWKFVSGL